MLSRLSSCFSCAVLPFLVRTWSGLAHANGIKSPSISMPSPYSQCALRGARDVSEVSVPWSLPSCTSSLPPSTTPSSQTSLGTPVRSPFCFCNSAGIACRCCRLWGPCRYRGFGTWTEVFSAALCVQGINPAPTIHEQFTIHKGYGTLRTSSRTTSTTLSTLRPIA